MTINGGTNGLIESTNNGSALAFQQDSYGVRAGSGSNNFTVRNLRIENMYVRTPYTPEDLELGNPIFIPDIGNNVTVENCYLTHGATLLNFSYTGGTRSNFIIRNNTFLYSNHTIGGGTVTNGAVLDGFEISGNTFDGFSQWRGQEGFHFDGIIFIFESPNSSEVIRGLRIFNNTFGPDIGGPPIGGVVAHNTAAIFVDTYVASQTPDTMIYNNLFLANPGESWTNGFINSNGLIFNNTIISGGGGSGIRCWDNTTIRNNVFYNVGNAISTNGITINISTVDSDYNIFYGLAPGSSFFVTPGPVDDAYEGTYSGLAQWQEFGFDAHSVAGQPLLDSNYVPTASDTLARDQGISLASYFTVDKRGISRPQQTAWDKGAFEFATGADTTPPTVTSAAISAAGTRLTLNFSESVSIGLGGNGGMSIIPSGGAASVTFNSGESTATSLVFTISRVIGVGETITRTYVQPGNGIEDSAGNDLASFTAAAVTNTSSQDITVPAPNPSTFSIIPTATGPTSISMTSTTTTDASSPPVQYFFNETSGNAGATDSGWQSSATFTDLGLSPARNTAIAFRQEIPRPAQRDHLLGEPERDHQERGRRASGDAIQHGASQYRHPVKQRLRPRWKSECAAWKPAARQPSCE